MISAGTQLNVDGPNLYQLQTYFDYEPGKITPEELVDGFMVPAHLTDEQRRTANQQLANVRQKRMAERSQQEKLYVWSTLTVEDPDGGLHQAGHL